jgi:plasmid stabilization system protein ParE
MSFKIKIEPEARLDIQEAINWYNKQQKGLAKKFHEAIISHFDSLKKNPHFEIRYDNIHCLPLKKFPYMLHFSIDKDKNLVIVRAIFHTSLNPESWKAR